MDIEILDGEGKLEVRLFSSSKPTAKYVCSVLRTPADLPVVALVRAADRAMLPSDSGIVLEPGRYQLLSGSSRGSMIKLAESHTVETPAHATKTRTVDVDSSLDTSASSQEDESTSRLAGEEQSAATQRKRKSPGRYEPVKANNSSSNKKVRGRPAQHKQIPWTPEEIAVLEVECGGGISVRRVFDRLKQENLLNAHRTLAAVEQKWRSISQKK
jgi:hypothetical protein